MTIQKQIEDFISQWDDGKEVEVIEMGGISDSYEKAIWETAVRFLNMFKNYAVPHDFWESSNLSEDARNKKYRDFLYGVDINDLGLSGAQFGAASNAASLMWRHGVEKAFSMAPKDRLIKISKDLS